MNLSIKITNKFKIFFGGQFFDILKLHRLTFLKMINFIIKSDGGLDWINWVKIQS
jgi:hypothetical protein